MIIAVLVASPGSAIAASCWRPPVDAPIADPFREPACRWCRGNRGIEFATTAGTEVRAAAAGTVSFAGVVAGMGYVVVRLPDGRRLTYGNIGERHVVRSDTVLAGSLIGLTSGRLHLGLRVGDRYLDPAPHLGHWVRRARLVPTDGTAGNPAPPPRLRCDAAPTVQTRHRSGGGRSEPAGVGRNPAVPR